MPASALHRPVLSWYGTHARDLPWRAGTTTPWGVLVSEVMLQQTPVARVEPVWTSWLARWATPADLAADAPGEAVRAWGRLGYPRRALRLHGAAVAIRDRHRGQVPDDVADLLRLPGVGTYTAAAVAAFAFGRRATVVDTNVRRVLARVVDGEAGTSGAPTGRDTGTATALLPDSEEEAALWSVAVMELGALVCTARAPRCDACPVAPWCAWRAAGRPEPARAVSRGPAWDGTDRQVRGRLLATLRESPEPVPLEALSTVWPDDVQRARCLESLLADGLAERVADDRLGLPAGSQG
jgi:A/G-specific adenine glycosylase